MVTIEQLTVTVRVEGDGAADEAAFARLFNKYIQLWQREIAAAAAQRRRSERDRSLGAATTSDGGGLLG